jgi:hypothetical protein
VADDDEVVGVDVELGHVGGLRDVGQHGGDVFHAVREAEIAL